MQKFYQSQTLILALCGLPQSPARRLNYGAQERGSCDAHAPADERIVFT